MHSATMVTLKRETEIFVCYFDKLFDCLNVRCLLEWATKCKPDRKHYTSPNERLEVCQTIRTMMYCMYIIIIVDDRGVSQILI